MLLNVDRNGSMQPLLLLFCECSIRSPILQAFSVFYFDKDPSLLIFHDEVNFTQSTTKILSDECQSMLLQKLAGNVFSLFAVQEMAVFHGAPLCLLDAQVF